MKLKSINKFAMSAIASAVFVAGSANAIEITTESNAQTLANALLIQGTGITITDVSLLGGINNGGPIENPEVCIDDVCGEGPISSPDPECPIEECGPQVALTEISSEILVNNLTSPQAGLFTNASGTYGLPSSGGLVFSTGDVADLGDGPNIENEITSSFFGSSASEEQNQLLSELSGQQQHFDPVELNISFDADEDVTTLSFIASFGSEEFPDFVGGNVTDAFGMFINGVNVAGTLIDPENPNAGLLPINIDHPDFAVVEGTALNGLIAPNGIPLICFDVPVNAGESNEFKLILADAGDGVYDSAVFISSFGNFDDDGGGSEFTPILPVNNLPNEDGAFVFVLPEVEANETIWFDPDVAVGYTYTATNGGLFASVTAPTQLTVADPDGYELVYLDANGVEQVVALLAGSEHIFSSPVSTFVIQGINTELMLDPSSGEAFVTGVSFSEAGAFTLTQTPITEFVDDGLIPQVSSPGILGLMTMGLAFLGFRRFKK